MAISTDEIDYQLYGNDMQLVEVTLDPGEAVQAESGTMIYMDEGIEMETSTGGGLVDGVKRMVTGESFFITTFANEGSDEGRVAFAAPYPGRIVPINLGQHEGQFLCQKDTFLCAAQGTNIEVEFQKKVGTGLFGGEGFILQRLEGNGMAFVHAGGTVVERELGPDETLRLDTGCLVAFDPAIDYDIHYIGGIKNALFGGEGLVLATLTGPGLIYLQSMPFSRLVDRINSAVNVGTSQGED
ncbi:MAG: TIGR00266 family protein [Candidatus Bipolaricaulia bacterium]